MNQELLSEWTTLGVGGPAGAFVEVPDVDCLADVFRDAERDSCPVLVLGGGSNLVVADEGFPGIVAHIAIRGVRFSGKRTIVVSAGAGEDWSSLVAGCVAEGLSGIECLSGIPGLAGATPAQNVGAYGQEIAQVMTSLQAWDTLQRRAVRVVPADCGFGYRTSIFKNSSRYVVTEISLRLVRSRLSRALRYPELATRLGTHMGRQVPLGAAAQAVMDLRRSKGMVLDRWDPDTRSAGSFFQNPILGSGEMAQLRAIEPDVPGFPAVGGTKVPAAWLVERSGFSRGLQRGGASISSKHALALTVRAGGTAAELVALAQEIRDGVRARFGVTLEPEPVLVGLKLS